MAVSKELKIRLPEYFYSALQDVAEKSGISMSAVMVSLLAQHINGAGTTPIRPRSDPDPGRPRNDPDPTPIRTRIDPDPTPPMGGIGGNVVLVNQPGEETTPTSEGVQGKQKKPRAVKEVAEHPGFAEFWEAYPKRCPRRDRGPALKSWNQHTPPLEVVLAALAWQDRQSDWAWADEKGEYGRIPMPATWINQHRWEREQPSGALAAAPVPTVNPYACGHPEWLTTDLAMGKTSVDYDQRTQRNEWTRHKLWETQRKDPAASYAR